MNQLNRAHTYTHAEGMCAHTQIVLSQKNSSQTTGTQPKLPLFYHFWLHPLASNCTLCWLQVSLAEFDPKEHLAGRSKCLPPMSLNPAERTIRGGGKTTCSLCKQPENTSSPLQQGNYNRNKLATKDMEGKQDECQVTTNIPSTHGHQRKANRKRVIEYRKDVNGDWSQRKKAHLWYTHKRLCYRVQFETLLSS